MSYDLLSLFRWSLNDAWDYYGDSRTENMPFMKGGPWTVLSIVGTYLLFVKWIGPLWMRYREPFDLRPIILIYNALMVGFNGLGFLCGLWITSGVKRTWDCSPIDREPTFINLLFIYFGWMYFASKFADLLDTIFFVLRKKQGQITLLHVFHHSVMPLIGWFGLKFHPSFYSGFLPLLNVFVHTVMYAYYALACAGPEWRKHLWWKRHITEVQMAQFILTLMHSLNAIFRPVCAWPTWLAILEGLHAAIFLYMFSMFYKKAYLNKSELKSQ